MRESTLMTARFALSTLVLVHVFVACGGSSRDKRGARMGTGGTIAGASGAPSGGSGGGSPSDAGEAGSNLGAAGSPHGSAGEGTAGDSGVGGDSPLGGASTGAVAGAASGAGGNVAGTSSSGGSAGDLGGTGGTAALPLPEGCEARGQVEDDDSCSIGVYCGSVPNLADCQRLDGGKWQCSCELANNDRTYEVDGLSGLPACAVAAGLCFEDELELGEETCRESGHKGADSCDLEVACGKPIAVPFAPDVVASLMEYGAAACSRSREGQPFECGCERDGLVVQDYGVLAPDGALACRPLADFCMSGAEPEFDEPTVCIERDSSVSSGETCDLYWTCAKPMRLTDDVSLALLEPRGASCRTLSSGSNCYCSTRTESFQFDVEAGPAAGTCEAAMLNCNEDASIVPFGEVSCQATSQTAGTDFCEADIDCLQSAMVDEREVVARGRLLVHCLQSAESGAWWCSCASNQDSTIFEFGASETIAWDVCSAAPAGCLEHMPVFIGPYGEYMPPPNPLPLE